MSLIKEQLDSFENKLIAEKVRLEAELETLKEETDMGSDTDHFEQETDETEEEAGYLGVRAVLDKRLRHIEKALDKIQKGGYGKCERCKGGIDEELLKEEPESSFCRGCKTQQK